MKRFFVEPKMFKREAKTLYPPVFTKIGWTEEYAHTYSLFRKGVKHANVCLKLYIKIH